MADAYDRFTRTPIVFRQAQGAQGRTYDYPPTIIDKLKSLFSGDSDKNLIEVDPASQNPHQVLKHEIAHAILNKLSAGQLDQSNQNIDLFPAISGAFARSGFKDPSNEIPAYAASGELQNIGGVQPGWQDQYIQKLQQELLKRSPQIAKWYQSLSASANSPSQ